MPKPKDPNQDREEREKEEREQREHEERARHERHEHENERREDEDKERPRRRRMGREHAVHQQILDRRLGGGAPATPEAYANALQQWLRLPGSVVRPPTDEKPVPATKPEGEDQEKKGDRS